MKKDGGQQRGNEGGGNDDGGAGANQKGVSVINLILCIAMLVSASIYLVNLNKLAASEDYEFYDKDCVPNLLPAGFVTRCANVEAWKSYAVLGIVRGGFFLLQIIGSFLLSWIFPPKDPKGPRTCGCLLSLISFAISFVLAIIPIYLAINLVRTGAIKATQSSLSQPAVALFVVCILELVGLMLSLLCFVCVALGIASCAYCCLKSSGGLSTNRRRGQQQQNRSYGNDEEKKGMKTAADTNV